MGLRIQNNIAAMNAHRQLGIADTGLNKSLERLSSGFRINRAADDAAGLAISQSFRADIASYKVASRNTSEASSLLQVAEGAADQIGNMLTRLKELATQASSANSDQNIQRIDDEAEKVLAEIERIAESTEYAQTSLINGTYGVSVSTTEAGVTSANGYESISGMKQSYTYNFDVTDTAGSAADITLTVSNAAGTEIGSQTILNTSTPGTGSTTTVSFAAYGVDLKINADISESWVAGNGDIVAAASGSSTFQVGSENQTDNQLDIELADLTKSGLGISTVDMSTLATAQYALDSIDAAITTLATKRGDIGAYMNRLSYASANLASTIENVQAAESVIRDVDMASEMTAFTKNQILLQAGTAMLAQANMAPQQVLSLFG
jgi:flagellin